jgi:hypothetical protein
MSLAAVQAKIDEAVTAQEAGDFATAITKIRSAKLLLAGMPTRSRQGESEIAFEREQLDSLLAELTRQQVASQSIQRTKFVRKPTSCE